MQKILKAGELKYILLNKLGQGASCNVYKGYSLSDNAENFYAIKIYKTEEKNHFEKEIAINQILPPNFFLSIISYGTGYIYYESKSHNNSCEIQKKEEVLYKMEELTENGDLFDFISNTQNGFSEKIAAKIFVNILKLVKILHDKKYVHKDIKPENILIGNDYSLKLIDFGFCQKIENRNNNLINSTEGSDRYCPPEIRKAIITGYDGIKSDIFSLGVLLFVITLKHFPFYFCKYSDKYYKLIMFKKYDKFWSNYKNYKLSDEFKDLINHLICYAPSERLNISQILEHPWIKNNCNEKDLDDSNIVNEDIINEFKKRKETWNVNAELN